MIKHVVMWKFKPDTKTEQRQFLDGLKSLQGQIENIRSMEILENQFPSCDCDAVLIMTFDSIDDLNAYKNDPRHVALSTLCKSIRLERHAVDSVIEG